MQPETTLILQVPLRKLFTAQLTLKITFKHYVVQFEPDLTSAAELQGSLPAEEDCELWSTALEKQLNDL